MIRSLIKSKMEVSPKPIVFETAQLVELPKVCMCCGKATKHTIVVKPTDPSNVGQELALDALGLVFPPAHIASAVKVLSTPNAKIPLCRKCRFKHFLPDQRLFIFIGMLALLFLGAFYCGLHAQYGFMLLALFLATACLIFIARKNMSHDINTLPIRIYRYNGKYRYAIFGGPLFEHFSKK